ncbi:MAG TPA: lyase family protein, partial [Candidatus Limnocylindrales bacterium]
MTDEDRTSLPPTTRQERDSMGEMAVPAAALYGASTQRAVINFPISGQPMPAGFIHALALIKGAAAATNAELGLLEPSAALAIEAAATEVAEGRHDLDFPIDIYQTGSGTSTNMNANEVIAHLAAARLGRPVHPNDEVNAGQSSNDVIPTAMQLAGALAIDRSLLPALVRLQASLAAKAIEFDPIVKTGRTHLQDATPIRLGQEFAGYAGQVEASIRRARAALDELLSVPLGGTAVGTGLNAPPGFGEAVAARLAAATGLPFISAPNKFAALASHGAL